MEFQIDSSVFLKALAILMKSCEKKLGQNGQGYYRLELTPELLAISVLSLEGRVEIVVPVMGGEVYSCLLPADDLLNILKGIPKDTLSFRTMVNRMSIQHRTTTFTVNMLTDLSIYREDPSVGEKRTVNRFPMADFLSGIGFAMPFVSTSQSEVASTGVLIVYNGEKLVFVSFGRYAMAVREVGCPGGEPFSMYLSLSAAKSLRSLAAFGGAMIEVEVGEGVARFVGDTCSLVTLQKAQKAPNYKSVIPQSYPYIMEIGYADLEVPVKRAVRMSVSDEPFLNWDVRMDSLTVTKSNIKKEFQAVDTLACSYPGPDMSMNLNAKYMLYAMTALPNKETVHVHLLSTNRLVLFESPKAEDDKVKVTDKLYLQPFLPIQDY